MLLLRNGSITEIAENGLLLGALCDVGYTERSYGLERGDRLLLYTDGMVEARNAAGEMFGEDALGAALAKTAGMGVGEAADVIVESVQRWARSQDDDLTVLICDYVPS